MKDVRTSKQVMNKTDKKELTEIKKMEKVVQRLRRELKMMDAFVLSEACSAARRKLEKRIGYEAWK